jgi:hypothetical protein
MKLVKKCENSNIQLEFSMEEINALEAGLGASLEYQSSVLSAEELSLQRYLFANIGLLTGPYTPISREEFEKVCKLN